MTDCRVQRIIYVTFIKLLGNDTEDDERLLAELIQDNERMEKLLEDHDRELAILRHMEYLYSLQFCPIVTQI